MNHNTLLIIVSFVFVLFVFFFVVRKNTSSVNLLLSFSVLAGSITMLLIHSWNELKDIEQEFIIKTQYTIYHDIPMIKRTGVSGRDKTLRRHYEENVSKLFSVKKTAVFDPQEKNITDEKFCYETNSKIYKDFVMNSLCTFFTDQERNWRESVSQESGLITFLITNPEEKKEDTLIGFSQLFDPSNMFTGVEDAGTGMGMGPMNIMCIGENIKMPHKTTITHPEGSLVIENPFCKVTFRTNIDSGIRFTDPDNLTQNETLPNGIPRHETRYMDLVVDVVYKGTYAKNKQMENYKNWVNRIIEKLDVWFS